jgi:hypothetical protein
MAEPSNFVKNWAPVWSAMLLWVPWALSLKYSTFAHSTAIGFAAFWSTMYHLSDQVAFGALDTTAAFLLSAVNVVMVLSAMNSLSFYDPRPIVASVLGAATLAVLFSLGYATNDLSPKPPQDQIPDYALYHSVWHILAALSTLSVLTMSGHFTAAWDLSVFDILRGAWKRK